MQGGFEDGESLPGIPGIPSFSNIVAQLTDPESQNEVDGQAIEPVSPASSSDSTKRQRTENQVVKRSSGKGFGNFDPEVANTLEQMLESQRGFSRTPWPRIVKLWSHLPVPLVANM